jgi:hypothetical protein
MIAGWEGLGRANERVSRVQRVFLSGSLDAMRCVRVWITFYVGSQLGCVCGLWCRVQLHGSCVAAYEDLDRGLAVPRVRLQDPRAGRERLVHVQRKQEEDETH